MDQQDENTLQHNSVRGRMASNADQDTSLMFARNMSPTTGQNETNQALPDFNSLLHGLVSESVFQADSMEDNKAFEFENAQHSSGWTELSPQYPSNTFPASEPTVGKSNSFGYRGRVCSRRITIRSNGSPIPRPTQLYIDPARGSPPEFQPREHVADLAAGVAPLSLGPGEIHQPSASQNHYPSASNNNVNSQGLKFMPLNSVTQYNQGVFHTFADRSFSPDFESYQCQMAQNQLTTWKQAPLQMPVLPAEPLSRHLSLIAPGGFKPNIDVACDPQNFPFIELLRRAEPAGGHGVVRITNIPYSTTRSEIIALLGRNAVILDDKHEPVHIIMDRVTGKTLDAYVEFKSVYEAVKAVDRQIETHRDGNKGGRLGKRFVVVEVAGPEQMMRALFPKAANVTWHGVVPQIHPPDTNDRYNTGFKGFLHSEELILLVKHIQEPGRVHFSEKCNQRPYESMISTIAKYPWFMVDHITIGDRDEIFNAAIEIIKCLLLRMSEDDLLLNKRLLKRLTEVMFACPGLTDAQKDDVCFICNINPYALRPALAPMADHWHVFKTIGAKPHVETDVLKYYIALLREATTSMDVVTLADRASTGLNTTPAYFGNIKIKYPPDIKYWTFSQVARIEWGVIDNLLRQVLKE